MYPLTRLSTDSVLRPSLLCLLLFHSACSGPSNAPADWEDAGPSGCSDRDGDGYGVGPDCAGPDCNDHVASVHAQAECDALCESNEVSPGCPCEEGEGVTCYTGPDGTAGVGECRSGVTSCVGTASGGRVWGECAYEVLPVEEVCDGLDDDCDGQIDQGLLSECGTCGECERDCTGPEEGCGDWGEDRTASIVETPEGSITLDGTALALHVIWPSSAASGDISRVNTRTHEVEAAYWTGPRHGDGEYGFSGDSPSRTAVDDYGNVIVANRAIGGIASITKILADPERCPDRNGNGVIETSEDWSDRLPFDTHVDWDDECIAWHTTVGAAVDAVARAVVLHTRPELDGAIVERGWVGLYNERRFLQFDTDTGRLTGVEAPTPGFSPYGAAVDREGFVWVTAGMGWDVGRFDTADPEGSFERIELTRLGWGQRIIVDENDVPWVSGTHVWRYDRARGGWDTVALPAPDGVFADVGNLASDGIGSVWVAKDRTGLGGEYVYRIDNDDELDWETVATPGVRTFGISVDFDGQVWAFGYETGNAAVIDADTYEVETVLDDCGGPCLHRPYPRGDVTGFTRRNALNPSGVWGKVVEGCGRDEPTDWKALIVDSSTPPGTRIVVQVRMGRTLDELNAAPWQHLGEIPADGSEIDLDSFFESLEMEDEELLAVQLVLQSDSREAAPVVRRVEVRWGCPSIFG